MLDWLFSPSLPIDEETRTWIDWRTEKLVDAFGKQRIFSGKTADSDTDFQETIRLQIEQAKRRGAKETTNLEPWITAVATIMNLSPKDLYVQIFQGDFLRLFAHDAVLTDPSNWTANLSGARSVADGKIRIILNRQILAMAWEDLVAVIAHQLAHALLLREGGMSGSEPDIEFTAELLAAYLGFVDLVNSDPRHLRERTRGLSPSLDGGAVGSPCCFTYPAFGYALAVWVRRSQTSDDWSRSLRLDVRHAYKKSIKWLKHQERHAGSSSIIREGDIAPPVPSSFFADDQSEGGCGGSCSCSQKSGHEKEHDCGEGEGSQEDRSTRKAEPQSNEFLPETPNDYFTRATILMETGDFENALVDFDEAIARGGDDADFSVGRAQALLGLHRSEEAMEEANVAVTRDPKDPSVYLIRAQVAMQLGLKEEALEDVNWIIEGSVDWTHVNVHEWDTYYLRGVVRLQLENGEGAVDDFTAALERRKTPELFELRAKAFDLAGETDRAANDRRVMQKGDGAQNS
jgi:hypothetical protein